MKAEQKSMLGDLRHALKILLFQKIYPQGSRKGEIA